jgi:hypothetical protein
MVGQTSALTDEGWRVRHAEIESRHAHMIRTNEPNTSHQLVSTSSLSLVIRKRVPLLGDSTLGQGHEVTGGSGGDD